LAYADTVAAARTEGEVVVYATTDTATAAPLIQDFEAAYPGVKVVYNTLNSSELHRRYLAENAAHTASADVLWSSAMDLQMKLANDKYGASYRSPEAGALPDWAVWRNAAYGTTYEPAVFVYSKRFVAPAEVPQTHADFLALLTRQRDKYAGKVSTYDIDGSAVGFLFATQDSRVQPRFWELVQALGAVGVNLTTSTAAMVERVATGRDYLGYNLIGSYALARAHRDPAIGIVMPRDYTLVMSRIALISATAPHPNAARLWLDYLLSRRGQTLLANRCELPSVRSDVEGESTADSLRQTFGPQLRAIGVGPTLLVFLDQAKRQEFLRRWRQHTAAAVR
jgi:iron(III) transport system substrate-binding protein